MESNDKPQEVSPMTHWLNLLRCPTSGESLTEHAGHLVSASGHYRYEVSATGIPKFASQFISADGRSQQAHYEKITKAYVENLEYPHTQEYMRYLDRVLLEEIEFKRLGTTAEICCGSGEAFHLVGDHVAMGVGVDVSLPMLEAGQSEHCERNLLFVQGDATMLPLADERYDSVLVLGGVHHVNDRLSLFREIARILKPGGKFYFREPLNDFLIWRWIRSVIYRFSTGLQAETERPLTYEETVPVLEKAGLVLCCWKPCGFIGFCFFMNSDVLVFNRLFRYLPRIRTLTAISVRFDEWALSLPGLQQMGLQVVGVAEKP